MLAPSRRRRHKDMIVWHAHSDRPFLFREYVQISYNAPSVPVLNCKKTCTIGAKVGPPRRAGRRRKAWTTGGCHEDLATSAVLRCSGGRTRNLDVDCGTWRREHVCGAAEAVEESRYCRSHACP